MRILVCGSRGFANLAATHQQIRAVLQEILPPQEADATSEPHVIIHGNAPCVDQLAGCAAQELGCLVEVFPADWVNLGRGAGLIRNRRMLEQGKPDLVLAFWDGRSRGTEHMIKISRAYGVPVEVIRL